MLKYDIEPLVRLYGKSEPVRYLVGEKLSRTEAYGIVHNDRTRWNPQHLSRLCEIFGCTLNDLVVYVGDNPNHPMAQLERPRIVELSEMFKGKPYAEVLRIYGALRKGEI